MPQPIVWLGLVRVVDLSTLTMLVALVEKQCWKIALPIQLVYITAVTLKMLGSVAKVSDLHLYGSTFQNINDHLQFVQMETSDL